MQTQNKTLQAEIARRRAFAIISHPDAGKTTLTEKLLLYGGAIQLAGSVKANRSQKRSTSDWMELEKQRGISVTSTVLQFEYEGCVLNLLDTPGHNDFSTDTYRTLTAADSAVMLVDNAKGVEAQTKKLFAVCRQRGIPIFTFVNKMDHEGIGPLSLLSEIEEALGIGSVPMNWPIGNGSDFKGVYDRKTQEVHLYQRTARGATKAGLETLSIDSPDLPALIGDSYYKQLREDIDLLEIAAEPFDEGKVMRGEQTPAFFGSALTNFGVEIFLRRFIEMAPPPQIRVADGKDVHPEDSFSGFVFKIQANMNPEHRDRVAFLRVVSGVFEKDMDVLHVQSGKRLKITRPQRLFAQERETLEMAYPGDVIGIPNPGMLKLGDTLRVEKGPGFNEVPTFAPETFAALQNRDTSKFKQYDKGVLQLVQEGLVELFEEPTASMKEYVLGAVGQLQFDVVLFRLATEYGIDAAISPLSQNFIAWVDGPDQALRQGYLSTGVKLLNDRDGRAVLLARSPYELRFIAKRHPEVKLLHSPGGEAMDFGE